MTRDSKLWLGAAGGVAVVVVAVVFPMLHMMGLQPVPGAAPINGATPVAPHHEPADRRWDRPGRRW